MATDEEILSSVADHLPHGVWVARAPGGELVFANAVFHEIMGIEAIDGVAVGGYSEPYAIHDTTGAPYREEAMPFVRALQAKELVVVDDIVIHRRDGRKVSIRAHAHPILDDAGTVTHVVIAFSDITREREAEDERGRARERIARMQRMETIGNLAGGVAHDFNNLLSAIHTIAASLQEDETDPARAKHLQTIQDVAESAAGLSRRLLDFAASRSVEVTEVSLHSIVRRVLANLAASLDGLEVDAGIDESLTVSADPTRLEQAIMNLVTNARDAGARSLMISGRLVGDALVMDFADDGSGVAADVRDEIFEPYFTTKEGQGARAGLGLATVARVVEAHGGTVTVGDSSLGGALFRVQLPSK